MDFWLWLLRSSCSANPPRTKPRFPYTALCRSTELDTSKLVERSQELQVMAQAEAQVKSLATTLGYAGALDTDSLWSMVEYRQRRSVEDILEMGRGLLLIKEQVGPGGFIYQCPQRGLHRRLASRLMGETGRASGGGRGVW